MLDQIDHVGIACHDLAAAIAFYESVFDLTVASRETHEDQGVHEAMLRLGEGPGPSWIQLLDLGTWPDITGAFPLPQLTGLGFHLPDVLIDLMPVVAGARRVERPQGCLPGDTTGLGTYPAIHTLSPSTIRRGMRNLS